MVKVLVTGGAGLIGSHVVDQLLARGHKAVVVDDLSTGARANVPAAATFYELDIRNAEGLASVFERERPQAVCHQAAQMSVSRSVREPAFDASINLVGLLNLLECSVAQGVERFVFASSGGVLYGDVDEPAAEDHPADPQSPYGLSKWMGEKYLEFFARQYGLKSVALRYANVYGPRQSPHGEAGVVAIFCQSMLNGRAATIHGDGSCVRDYVFVEDVARANVLALERKLPRPMMAFNIGTGRPTDVNQLAAHLHDLCSQARAKAGAQEPAPAPTHGPPRAGDLRSNLVSAAAAAEHLGWSPTVSLEEGLARTVSWFAER